MWAKGLAQSLAKHSINVTDNKNSNDPRGPSQWHSGKVHTLHFGGPGFAGSDPRRGPTHHLSSHAVAGVPHIK